MTAAPHETRLPLEGVRVLDFGMFQAGPTAARWLADAGAETIKIESCSHPDNLRILARGVYPDGEPGERPWNRSGMINVRNRNKLGITLEMADPRGLELFKRLVAISDVVIENFSTRVLPRWELDYPRLREINRGIILTSLYSQGGTGPESSFVSFGPTLEQLGGLVHLTGYPDELPGIHTVAFPDPIAGAMAVTLVLAALRQRRQSGEGAHIDLSQRENMTSMLGEFVLDYSMNGRVAERIGNRDQQMAPHGCYRCRGEDAWIAIAVETDEQWERLCDALGQPALAAAERFATVSSRRDHQDELDAIISEWTATRGKVEAMEELQRNGVAAGAVYTAADAYADPHLQARDFWEAVDDPDAGRQIYPGRPMHLSETPLTTRRPTPTLGQHNEYVFGDLLGLSEAELAELEASGIIGTEPTEVARQGRL